MFSKQELKKSPLYVVYKFVRGIYKKIFKVFYPKYKKSYSQCGEDLIVNNVLKSLKISNPTYLDIGAYQADYLSNTYFFYKKGLSGVCVEPDPNLFKEFKKKRKRDICLNIGVGLDNRDEADFYVMSVKTLNTFSKKEAERYQSYGTKKIVDIIKIPLISVNSIIEKNFKQTPNFVSIDVEGLDFDIIKSFDFSKYRPEVFCIETIEYTEDRSGRKINEIIELMKSKKYSVYCDTYVNTIFVDEYSVKK